MWGILVQTIIYWPIAIKLNMIAMHHVCALIKAGHMWDGSPNEFMQFHWVRHAMPKSIWCDRFLLGVCFCHNSCDKWMPISFTASHTLIAPCIHGHRRRRVVGARSLTSSSSSASALPHRNKFAHKIDTSISWWWSLLLFVLVFAFWPESVYL